MDPVLKIFHYVQANMKSEIFLLYAFWLSDTNLYYIEKYFILFLDCIISHNYISVYMLFYTKTFYIAKAKTKGGKLKSQR